MLRSLFKLAPTLFFGTLIYTQFGIVWLVWYLVTIVLVVIAESY